MIGLIQNVKKTVCVLSPIRHSCFLKLSKVLIMFAMLIVVGKGWSIIIMNLLSRQQYAVSGECILVWTYGDIVRKILLFKVMELDSAGLLNNTAKTPATKYCKNKIC
jgi:hypothetical protein